MASKIMNLVALSLLAILSCSFSSSPVVALSVGSSHVHARDFHHINMAKKKRADSRRCKPRPSAVSAKPASTSAPAPKPTTTTAKATPKPSPTPPPPAPAPPPPSSGRGKAGLAWPNGDNPSALAKWRNGKVSTIYSWSVYKPGGSDAAGLDFWPQLWGGDQRRIDEFRRLVKPGIGSAILSINEPDLGAQSNMSPSRAAQLHIDVLNPYADQGFQIGSPAVASSANGKRWFREFIAACAGRCRINFDAIHFYGTNAQDFIKYVQDWHSEFGRPVAVTEFACQSFSGQAQCNPQQITQFMDTATAFLDSTSYVKGYNWFGAMTNLGNVNPQNALIDGGFNLTPLGRNYNS